MPISFSEKERYDTADLLEILRILRSPGGCPWDRAQTHLSIRDNMLEEAYEVIDAIDREDDALMTEELGDVLLQVLLHTQIASEDGRFSFADVVDGLCKKLVQRHPHVFGEQQAHTAEEGLKMWDAAKRRAKGAAGQAALLRSVPKSMPALMRAEKVQSRAKRVGFDWKETAGAVAALRAETDELCEAIAAGDPDAIRDELGDLLFSAVNVSRFVKVNPETALTASSDKFIDRFETVEQIVREQGASMEGADEAQLDAWWAEAKKRLAANR